MMWPPLRLLPPVRPLCRRCNDRGYLLACRPCQGGRSGGVIILDACPDCTRAAEARWVGLQLCKMQATRRVAA